MTFPLAPMLSAPIPLPLSLAPGMVPLVIGAMLLLGFIGILAAAFRSRPRGKWDRHLRSFGDRRVSGFSGRTEIITSSGRA